MRVGSNLLPRPSEDQLPTGLVAARMSENRRCGRADPRDPLREGAGWNLHRVPSARRRTGRPRVREWHLVERGADVGGAAMGSFPRASGEVLTADPVRHAGRGPLRPRARAAGARAAARRRRRGDGRRRIFRRDRVRRSPSGDDGDVVRGDPSGPYEGPRPVRARREDGGDARLPVRQDPRRTAGLLRTVRPRGGDRAEPGAAGPVGRCRRALRQVVGPVRAARRQPRAPSKSSGASSPTWTSATSSERSTSPPW